MRARHGLALLTASVAIVLPSWPAWADSARAEELFRQGRALLSAGQLEQACRAFAQSHEELSESTQFARPGQR